MKLEQGMLLRYTENPSEFWKVTRLTPKSAWLARSDPDGSLSVLAKHWQFRKATVERDFHPA